MLRNIPCVPDGVVVSHGPASDSGCASGGSARITPTPSTVTTDASRIALSTIPAAFICPLGCICTTT